MAAWLIKVWYSEEDEPGVGSFLDSVVVSADTLENAIAALRAHSPSDPSGSYDAIQSIERIGEAMLDASGRTVNETATDKSPT